MRIAIAGFQHETNTFAPSQAGLAEFKMADSWPAMLEGAAVLEETRDLNLPIAGAVHYARAEGAELRPILWCAAEPSGPVTDPAFEVISDMILTGLSDAAPLDGVYLDLHGAMVTQSHEDGEGELLDRVRRLVGDKVPVVVSLDLHANTTAKMVDSTDFIAIYRTYPHLDMAKTGARAMAKLCDILRTSKRPAKAFRQSPFLVPLHAQYTGAEPCQSLYQQLDTGVRGPSESADLAMGFTAADIFDCGPSVVAYAQTQARADEIADTMIGHMCDAEAEFDTALLNPDAAVAQALSLPGPVVLADVQDNAGAGGMSDTTGLLKALVRADAAGSLVGVVCDQALAKTAHEVGVGKSFEGALGGHADTPGQSPFDGTFEVEALSDGAIAYSGEMYGGGIAEIGPTCLISIACSAGDIKVVVSSLRTQCLDRAFFEHFGLDLTAARIICVKSTVHFRADFAPIASHILNVAAPGAFGCKLDEIPYRRIRPNVRVGSAQAS